MALGLLSLGAFLACTGASSSAEDTAEDGPGGMVSANECGLWAAIEQARAWDYHYVPGGDLSGDWTTDVQRFKAGAGTLREQGSFTQGKVTQDYTTTRNFECSDGLFLTAAEQEYAGTDDGVPFSGATTTHYDEPVLLWPATLAKGDSWDAHYQGSTHTDAGSTPLDYTETYTVEELEPVEVREGAFKAFRVSILTDSVDSGELWVASGFGVVAGTTFELTDLR